MLSSGLPESTIVLKIHKAAYFGLVDLDSSPAALIVLKGKGAGEQILNAVVWAEPYGAERKEAQAAEQQAAQQKQLEEQAAPGLPDGAGVYFKGSSAWVRLPAFLFWTPLYSGWAWMRGERVFSIPIANEPSEVPVSGAAPIFYRRSPRPDEGWQIVHVASRNHQRQLRLISGGVSDQTDKLAASQVTDVQVKPVAGGIFALQPKAQLQEGEYALCTGVSGGRGLKECYSFNLRQ